MPSAVSDPTPPPAPESIDALPRFPGGRTIHLAITKLVLSFEGVPDDLAAEMERRLAPFVGADGEPLVRIAVHDAGRPHFLPPPEGTKERVYRMSSIHQDGVLRLAAHGFAGWLHPAEGSGAVALCHGSFDPPPRALENFMRAAVAWAAVENGGFLIHSASIVRNGQAHLFFGASGAGKSTLAAISSEGTVVSDDLTVVLPADDGSLHVAGSPFRGTYTEGEPVVGHYPIHSAYRLRQDERTYVSRQAPSIAAVELLSNLTFVVDQIGRVPGLAERLEERLRMVPTYRLHFRKDADFWRAIEEYHVANR